MHLLNKKGWFEFNRYMHLYMRNVKKLEGGIKFGKSNRNISGY